MATGLGQVGASAADQALVGSRFASVTAVDQWLSEQGVAAWARLDPAALQTSFQRVVLPSLRASVTAAQTTAAKIGSAFVYRAANETDPHYLVEPAAFAGTATDGGALGTLLAQPLVSTYVDLANGVASNDALAGGLDALDRILTTVVQDAARASEQVAMATTRITYYVRVVEPGACSRCLVLSAKRYKYSKGFLRHPSCRCFHVPETIVRDDLPSAVDAFNRMSPAERDAAFGAPNARAIELGADLNRVVNATGSTSGMSSVLRNADGSRVSARTPLGGTIYGTRAGTQRGGFRPIPEGIFALAPDDVAEQLRLLQLHGYITTN